MRHDECSPGEQKPQDKILEKDYSKAEQEAAEMLKRIGWHPSDLKQIEVYSRMSPARKVAQMFWWRGEQIRLLKERLEGAPGLSDMEWHWLLQEHRKVLVREYPRYGSSEPGRIAREC